MNKLITREEVTDIFIDVHEGLLEALYSKPKLTAAEKVRKAEIEYILSYFRTEDVLDTIENGIGTGKD